MRRFIVRFFAVIGLLFSTLVALLIVAALWGSHAPKEPNNVVLTLDLNQPIVEQNVASPLAFLLHDEEPVRLLDAVNALDHAKLDPHVKGLVVHFSADVPNLAKEQELRDAIKRFRASGKFTYAFAASYGDFGLSDRAYYLASAFENIWLQPVGSVGLNGIAIQSPFFKEGLDRFDVKADFMQREEYKSFMEMAMRNEFSPPVRANMKDLLGSLTDQIAGGIAEGRQWSKDKVRQLMAEGPFTGSEAIKIGLVTHLGYADQLDDEIKKVAGKDSENVSLGDYEANFGSKEEKGNHKVKVALIYGLGLIAEKPAGVDRLASDEVMDVQKVEEAFNTAAKDKKIQAILFRVESPGGSPDDSETIRRALIHAKEKGKPVFVSMGSVAASGGYWISMSADYIAAEPGTMTGSIGVLAGKFVLGGLLKKYGVGFDTIASDDSANLWSMEKEFTPLQRARVNALLDDTYRNFVAGVAEGRHLPLDKMPGLAKGRVWSGEQALKVGLVDEVGGYVTTLAAIRKKLNLSDKDTIVLEEFPKPQSPALKFLHMFKSIDQENASLRSTLMLGASVGQMLRPLLGAAMPQHASVLDARSIGQSINP